MVVGVFIYVEHVFSIYWFVELVGWIVSVHIIVDVICDVVIYVIFGVFGV